MFVVHLETECVPNRNLPFHLWHVVKAVDYPVTGKETMVVNGLTINQANMIIAKGPICVLKSEFHNLIVEAMERVALYRLKSANAA